MEGGGDQFDPPFIFQKPKKLPSKSPAFLRLTHLYYVLSKHKIICAKCFCIVAENKQQQWQKTLSKIN